MMNTYNAYFAGRSIEIKADTILAAKEKAIAILRPGRVRMGLLSVVLAAVEERIVEHDGASI